MDFFFIKDSEPELASQYGIGGKAANLFRLKAIYTNVPKFVVIPQEITAVYFEEKRMTNEAGAGYTVSIKPLPGKLEELLREFPQDALFAVRSSAIAEDGNEHSFAGQFATFLFVPKERLLHAMLKVYASAKQARVAAYINFHRIKNNNGIAIIIQEMINADVSGVAYGIDPINGNRSTHVISAAYGLGEGLVSGDLNADSYKVNNGMLEKEIISKEYKLVFNNEGGHGLEKRAVDEIEKTQPALTDEQAISISNILNHCKTVLGRPQDIEFAIKENHIFLLQTRPVTILNKLPDETGQKIVWDNSNIIESYPGVTTPLTFSFISKSYEGAYKSFSAFMGVNNHVIATHENVFANTLGFINGRVYYNLRNWYLMLAMLPGYSINARFMEKMMGVKERFDIPKDLQLSKTAAWWRVVKMAVRMYGRFLSLPKERKAFRELLNETIDEYKQINYGQKTANELMQLYRNFEQRLLNNWKAPLLNDFFAMIWFGLLEKRCKTYLKTGNPNIHNDLLCGSSDIISVAPIHRTIELATWINNDPGLKQLFLTEDAHTIWKKLQEGQYERIRKFIEKYIDEFGERCVGELKLETISYTQDPALFIKVIQSYVTAGITANSTDHKIEEQVRQKAEATVEEQLQSKRIKKYILKRTINRARDLVSNRENLRYERTRAFGIVRMIFSHIGKAFYLEGIIDNPGDIYYLTKEEIFSFIEGTSVFQDISTLIKLRKQEFDRYKAMEAPAARFTTYGPVYFANDFKSKEETIVDGDLKGIGCSPGKVRAKLRVVLNPQDEPALNGDILVTISTDPGWVTLFPAAGGIIVERGSLLSHSAIVAREMGKPCIVGVSAVTRILKTGDIIEMDGSTGDIKIIGNEG